MKTLHHLVRIVELGVMVTALLLSPSGGLVRAMADEGVGFARATTSPYGTFNGIEYLKHEGRFVGTTAGDYSVPFEIVAPADPTRGNGVVLMEVLHPMGKGARNGYLTPEFLFFRGFSYAVVDWHPDDVDPFEGYSTEEAVDVLHNFALALRQDVEARALAGSPQQLYAVAVSKSCEPLHSLLHSPGRSLLDFTMLIVPERAADTHEQPEDSNPVTAFLTESDLVRSAMLGVHTAALRGSSSTYRSYEVAGAPHVPDVPWIRELTAPMGASSEDTTPLDWTPVARALFLAGHHWAIEGIEPPSSVSIAQPPVGQSDPAYEAEDESQLVTQVARDDNGNALGGIRLPDLELGRGQFIAVDPASFFGSGL